MTTTLNASTAGAGGFIATSDNSGVLALQTGGTTAITVDTSANVGIGTTSPVGKFHAKGTASADVLYRLEPTSNAYASKLLISSTSSGDGGLRYGYGGSNELDIFSYDNMKFFVGTANISGTVGNERMRIDSSGNLLVGTTSTYALPGSQSATVFTNTGYAVGNGTTSVLMQNNKIAFNASNFYVINGNTGSGVGVYIANGATSWSAFSDERVKDIIEPIANATEKVSSLRAVIGKYKTDSSNKRRSFLIAQDVQSVFPEAVNVIDDEQGTLGLQYTDLIPLLAASIKELKAELDELKAKVNA